MYRMLLAAVCGRFAVSVAYAHQPVMDMAPRWENGFGLQLRHEYYGSDELMDGDSEIANPFGLERFVNRTWLESVYTFDRSKRVTFKLPYINQRRIKNVGGVGVKQKNSGLGDLINAGMFVMWDVTARYNGKPSTANLTTASGGKRIQSGPILVLYKDNIMFRGEYKYPIYENTSTISNSRGQEFNIGIRVTF